MRIDANSRLLFIGDSITDVGRARPVGEGAGLGNGYVAQVNQILSASFPEKKILVQNTGISGNQVTHLKARWQSDVLDLKPDWLSIMIGTNDVWRQFDHPNNPEMHVLPDQYESVYRELLTRTRPMLKGLVLMTPFLVEPNPSEPMRAKMDLYGQIVKRLAKAYNARFVDVQANFNHAMESIEPKALAGDRVHPGPVGHMILARGFLKAVDFQW